MSSIFGPEAVIASTNIPDAIKRVFTGFGIDQKGLIKTPEQLQQEQQQQQQAQQQQQQAEMVKAAIPNAVTQGGDMIKQGAQQQNG